MARPFVSVLIDTYNHERFIEEAIESVLAQDFPASEREILVVDDGSTDKTPDILKRHEPRISVLQKQNGGQASAFNYAIPECRGEVIAFLDGDDWWTKDKLATIVPIFESQPDIGGVGHGCLMVDTNGNLQSTVLPTKSLRLNARTPEAAREFVRHGGFFGTSKVAYRRSILQQILPIPEGAIIEADEWMFTLAPWLAEVLVLDRALFYYRLHGGNMFMLSDGSETSLRRKYNSIACLAEHLPLKMRALGIPLEIETQLLVFLRLQIDTLRLQLDGGTRWDFWKVEKATNDFFVSDGASLGYRIFKEFALLMTLLVPGKQFVKLKRWYGESGLRRARNRLFPSPEKPHIQEDRHTRP
jgi:glycosyltransferase involved in cell wall biosynthesis